MLSLDLITIRYIISILLHTTYYTNHLNKIFIPFTKHKTFKVYILIMTRKLSQMFDNCFGILQSKYRYLKIGSNLKQQAPIYQLLS